MIGPLGDVRIIGCITVVLLLGIALIGMEWEARVCICNVYVCVAMYVCVAPLPIWKTAGSNLGRVKPKTLKLVLAVHLRGAPHTNGRQEKCVFSDEDIINGCPVSLPICGVVAR